MNTHFRSSQKIQEITFKRPPVFTLIPKNMLVTLFTRSQQAHKIILRLDPYFPPDYIVYCSRILDTNQYPEQLQFFLLVQEQLQNLHVNSHTCFSTLKCITVHETCHILVAEYTAELRQITLTGGIFVCRSTIRKKNCFSFFLEQQNDVYS